MVDGRRSRSGLGCGEWIEVGQVDRGGNKFVEKTRRSDSRWFNSRIRRRRRRSRSSSRSRRRRIRRSGRSR